MEEEEEGKAGRLGEDGQGHNQRGSQSVGSGSARNTLTSIAANLLSLPGHTVVQPFHITGNFNTKCVASIPSFASQDAEASSRSGAGVGLGACFILRRPAKCRDC